MKALKSFALIFILIGIFMSCGDKGGIANNGSSSDIIKLDTSEVQIRTNEAGRDGRFAWQKPDFVISRLGDLSNKVVADIGAGTGYFTFRLLNKAQKVIAVDIDTNSIVWINSFTENLDSILRQKVETRLALPNDARLGDNEVDVIIIINTIGYIQQHEQYLRNLRKSLKPGGKLMIVDFKIKRIPEEIAPKPSNRVSILHLEDELEEAGYQLLETDDTSLDFQYIIVAKNRNG